MIRAKITDPWQEVSWEEAIAHAASEFKRIQATYGRGSVGGITSSRCTNEETYLVQKLVRAGFGNNNVDTCARVCHSPTGYGLGTAFGTSAGTQDFDFGREDATSSSSSAPTRPTATRSSPRASRSACARARGSSSSIRAGPTSCARPMSRRTYHLPLLPGTNVAVMTALAHVIVTEGLVDEAFVRERCDLDEFRALGRVRRPMPRNSPEALEAMTGVPADGRARRRAALCDRRQRRDLLRPRRHRAFSQGSTTVMAIANLAMATGNLGREGVGVNPLRGQNNVQGSCDMGSFPHELPGYRHISNDAVRSMFEEFWGAKLDNEPGLRIPNMLDAAVDGSFKGLYIQGEDIAQSDPDTKHVTGGPRGDGVRRRAGPVPERDGELRPCLPAGLDLPREGRHLHQCRAPHPARAQGDERRRRAMPTGR